MIFLVLTHVTVALTSLVYTTYTFARPSRTKLRASYVLVAGTLVSGTFLIIMAHSNLLSTCISGLLYLSAVFSGLFAARHKLVRASARSTRDFSS